MLALVGASEPERLEIPVSNRFVGPLRGASKAVPKEACVIRVRDDIVARH